MKSDKQLQQENPELYRVAREKGTEQAFQGKYLDTKDIGMYHCAVCDAQLFSSEAKFNSGTGWPSFSDSTVKEAIKLKEDFSCGIMRTEVFCKECGVHLGHVFNDGPQKMSGSCNRFCINSVSLNFKEK